MGIKIKWTCFKYFPLLKCNFSALDRLYGVKYSNDSKQIQLFFCNVSLFKISYFYLIRKLILSKSNIVTYIKFPWSLELFYSAFKMEEKYICGFLDLHFESLIFLMRMKWDKDSSYCPSSLHWCWRAFLEKTQAGPPVFISTQIQKEPQKLPGLSTS